jgi:hypothetical protein
MQAARSFAAMPTNLGCKRGFIDQLLGIFFFFTDSHPSNHLFFSLAAHPFPLQLGLVIRLPPPAAT